MTHAIHGTALSIGGKGVLLRGSPGSGKSALALRLIDAPGYGLVDTLQRARLVADDQVMLERIGAAIWMTPPLLLAGKLEIRGIGIVEIEHKPEAELVLIVDLLSSERPERMPEIADLKTKILGVEVALLTLDATDPAAPAKVRAALTLAKAQRVATNASQE
jgi:HPr kinase/phosphorylase